MGIHLVHKVWHNCEGIFPVYIPMYNMVADCGNLMSSKEVPMTTWYSSQWNSEMTIREFLSMLNTRYATTVKESSVCTYTSSVFYHILCIMDCGGMNMFSVPENEMFLSYRCLMQHYPSLHFGMLLQILCIWDLWIAEALLLVENKWSAYMNMAHINLSGISGTEYMYMSWELSLPCVPS